MRSIICISLLAAAPATADGRLGCFAVDGLTDRPVSELSLYIYHNASRQGRYATIQADGAQIIVPCPTDSSCISPASGGSMFIQSAENGIEVITERFVFDGIDLGNGSLIPERYSLQPADQSACGSPRARSFSKTPDKSFSKILAPASIGRPA